MICNRWAINNLKNETALGESQVMIYYKVNKMQSAKNFFQFFKLSLLHQKVYREINLLRLILLVLSASLSAPWRALLKMEMKLTFKNVIYCAMNVVLNNITYIM